jgi:hypothetical protein
VAEDSDSILRKIFSLSLSFAANPLSTDAASANSSVFKETAVFEEDSDSFVDSKNMHDSNFKISEYKNERRSNERVSIAMQ